MIEVLPLVSAALLAGLLGSAHCLGMCAGISGLFAVNAGVASLRASLPFAFTYNVGRIATYAVLGGIVGLFGSVIVKASPSVATGIRLMSGIIIVLVGLRVAFDLRLLNAVERMGASIWSRIAPAAKGLVPVTTLPRAFGLGLLWGWLPCGLVYSVLMIAATSLRPDYGVAVMVAFGIGTMPAMLVTGLGAARLAEMMRKRGTRLGMGLLIVTMGLLTAAMPLGRLLPSGIS
ncbi:MAG: sulfite exporter TauE/SafE family protein [Woeseiaceae bacterium]|nr:sulfite exporter TauE/SafE family protein [Woeseiaceae bacterium]NIP19562.1 sulfite exporter TauE/SafE family protein [Woeseiaceae bacterium]NIS88516.1 sulfite exporter TauE/SafE family protein [Woeseiaceae bacterium]